MLLGIALLTAARPAVADPWYEHYFKAEQAIEAGQWKPAVQELNQALEKKGDSGARVRSYGMNVTPYFPYLKLGIAYYHLGQHDAALQAFETEARLGAVAQSPEASAELDRYRTLARDARAETAAAETRRIRGIVERSLGEARNLENRGLLTEAVAALDRALAVAPDDGETQAAMSRLRERVAERGREQELAARAAGLIDQGRALLAKRQYSEAASILRQALFLRPDPEAEKLLEAAQTGLLAQLGAGPGTGRRRAADGAGLDEILALESAGQFATALNRLQSILVLDPSDEEARSIQRRLLQAQRDAEAARARQASVSQLLAEAGERLEAGSTEQALSAANRVLALDPGNSTALEYVAQAYRVISRELLGGGPGGNLPPAVRFVDLRQEDADGALVQTVSTPDFTLNGVIVDNSPVEVAFYGADERELASRLSVQPFGGLYVTEFSVRATLAPGRSTFRLVARDAEDLASSSEYAVVYARPIHRAPWFFGLLLGGAVALGGALLWRRALYRGRLRKRRFNPYVAGAPVVDEKMFFGRRQLVDRILQTVHNNSLLIHGERRIGKTSIQHELKRRLLNLDDPQYEFHPVYVDLQGTPEARFFRTMIEEIFQELAPLLDGLRPTGDAAGHYDYRDFVRDLHAVLRALRKRTSRKVKLVLLIDEVDELNAYDPRTNQKLRSLFMRDFAENLVAVVSGVQIKRKWEMEGSPWYNFFEEIDVQPFGPQEARELIERPIRGMFRLDGGVVDRIIALAAGRPYLIQKLCIALVTRLHEQDRRRITLADVEAVADVIRA